uniref:Uncharacterized protein n=1 Tax=Arundo donax TaxID=35708 RepID=A0A0A8YDG4_ARUDO
MHEVHEVQNIKMKRAAHIGYFN